MQAIRTGVLIAVTAVLLASCSADDPVGAAANAICEAIDAEVSDVAALEAFELAVARERRNDVDEDELQAALDERCGRAIIAISAAGVVPVEEQSVDVPVDEEPVNEEAELEVEPAPSSADLRELDWANQRWETVCTESEEMEALTLSRGPDAGQLTHNPDSANNLNPWAVYTVDEASVVYGDITGDELEDAVVISECFFGNYFAFSVEVWSHTGDGQPLQLPAVITYTKSEGSINRVDVVEGSLRIHTSELAPDDPNPPFNGYSVQVVTDWSYDGAAWNATETERTDVAAPPSPQPELAGRFTDPEAYRIRDAFQMPSGNVYCGLIDWADVIEDADSAPYLDCIIVSGMNPIPTDYDCPVDWTGIGINMKGDAGPNCAGDTWVGQVRPSDYPILGYGQTWTYDEITCRSAESGLSCENRSGGAFMLARNSWSAR
jgi:hypothetical protein